MRGVVAFTGVLGGGRAVAQTALRSASVPRGTADVFDFSVSFPGATTEATFSVSGVPAARNVTVGFFCTHADCIQVVGAEPCAADNYRCDHERVEARCLLGRPGAVFEEAAATCGMGAPCGTCAYHGVLAAVCVPVAVGFAAATAAASATKRSCRFPFSEHHYESEDVLRAAGAGGGSAAVVVTLMDELDPAIALAAATEGSGDFGVLLETQQGEGLAMIIAGSVLLVVAIALSVFAFVVVIRLERRAREEAAAHDAGKEAGHYKMDNI